MQNNFKQAEIQQLKNEQDMIAMWNNCLIGSIKQKDLCPHCEKPNDKKHLSICEHRPLPCEFCGIPFPISIMKDHLQYCEIKKKHQNLIENIQSQNPRPQTAQIIPPKAPNQLPIQQVPLKHTEDQLNVLRQQYKNDKSLQGMFRLQLLNNLRERQERNLNAELESLRDKQKNIQVIRQQEVQRVEQQQQIIENYQSKEKKQQNQSQNNQEKFVEILFTKSRNLSPSALNCIICSEDYREKEKILITECLHKYHQDCLKQWLKKQNNCPICKNTL